MEKKKLDPLSEKFKKQTIANLTSIKGRSIDYACARGVMGGDSATASESCASEICCGPIIDLN